MQTASDKSRSNNVVKETKKISSDGPHSGDTESVSAPLSGNIWKVMVEPNQHVSDGDVLVILEAMKMETEIRAAKDGVVVDINVKEGDYVKVGQSLITIA
jgi:oxaloacetate decarboxylase alpha subunit